MTKMKKMISMIALSATALLLTGCSSEIPEGDASHFNSLPSFDELIVTKTYLPLKHPCMLHAAVGASGAGRTPRWKKVDDAYVLTA